MINADEYAILRHELKGSLTTIRLYTESLLSESSGPLTAEQREHLEEIASANATLISRVSKLGKE